MSISATVSWRACVSSLAALALLVSAGACGTNEAERSTAAQAPAGPMSTPVAPAADAAPAGRVLARLDRRQRSSFALLRTPPEPLPERTRQILSRPMVGMNWDLAQRIPVALPGAYWLVPGVGYLCIVSQTPANAGVGTICAKTRQVLHDGFASVAITPADRTPEGRPSRLIVGVAPDGTRKVLIHTRGSVATAPVADGLFVHRDAVGITSDFLTLR